MSAKRVYTLTNKSSGATRRVTGREAARSLQRSQPGIWQSNEYTHRQKLGHERGLSSSQMRGHADTGAGERAVSTLKSSGLLPKGRESTEARLYNKALPALRRGESIRQAAQASGMSESTLRREALDRGLIVASEHRRLSSGKSVVSRLGLTTEHLTFHVPTSDGDMHQNVPLDAHNASIMGGYWNAHDKVLEGSDRDMRWFEGRSIRDIHGNRYVLDADSQSIRDFDESMSEGDRRKFYQTLYTRPESIARRAA